MAPLNVFDLIQMHNSGKIRQPDVEHILAFALHKPREYVIAHPEHRITARTAQKIARLVNLRLRGYPLAYITGIKEFYGMDFRVNESVLIPRPETELIVERILDRINSMKRPDQAPMGTILLADLGTGSGCIIIALARNLPLSGPKTKIAYYAVDNSIDALKIARENAGRHRLNAQIQFKLGDLLGPVKNHLVNDKRINNIFIAANLPYVGTNEYNRLPTIKYEPRNALASGIDGLAHYRRLAGQLAAMGNALKKQKRSVNASIFCELDPAQINKAQKLFKKVSTDVKFIVHQDYSGRDRILECVFGFSHCLMRSNPHYKRREQLADQKDDISK